MIFRRENDADRTQAVDGNTHGKRPSRRRARAAVIAGVAVAVPAAGLAASSAASAASVSTWDRVAQCESSGDWSINTGNGFSGGLQFTNSTWAAYGGTAYAPIAAEASKGQQIAVAERVLNSQGPGAWPVCGPRAGLTRGGAAADVSTEGSATTHHSTVHRGTTHAVRNSVEHLATSARQSGGAGGHYTVRAGDTLSGIAAAHGLFWKALYQDNRQLIGGNPDFITPGERLAL